MCRRHSSVCTLLSFHHVGFSAFLDDTLALYSTTPSGARGRKAGLAPRHRKETKQNMGCIYVYVTRRKESSVSLDNNCTPYARALLRVLHEVTLQVQTPISV